MATTHPLPDAAKLKQMLGRPFDRLEVPPGTKFDSSQPSGKRAEPYVVDDGTPVVPGTFAPVSL